MKILVLSLLRLGDLLQQRPLLRRLKSRYPGAELHVLINTAARAGVPLCEEVDRFHFFDREHFQKSIGTAELPLMKPVFELENLTESLSRQNFDLILNFTHNRLSAHLMAAIEGKSKQGLLSEGMIFRRFENEWLRFFNERFSGRTRQPFHYVELLAKSFDLDEVEPVSRRSHLGETLYLQPLTSDEKKNWGLSNWRHFVDEIHRRRPDLSLKVLGAPFEAETLRRFFAEDELEIVELREAQRLLREGRLLISGDTSIKHLAVSEGLPVIELALGPADPDRTAAFGDDAWILSAQVPCAPCPHSRPCSQLSHLCAEEVSVQALAEFTLAVLEDGIKQSPSAQMSPRLRVQKSLRGPQGLWLLRQTQLSLAENLANWIEKSFWALHLDHLSRGGLPESGSVAQSLSQWVREQSWGPSDLKNALQILETENKTLEALTRQLQSRLSEVARACVASGLDPVHLTQFRRELSGLGFVSERVRLHMEALVEAGQIPMSTPFHFFGWLRKKLEELSERTALKTSFLQQIRDWGGEDGKTTRQLPEDSPRST